MSLEPIDEIEEPVVLRIVKEDILRILGETGAKISVNAVKSRIKASGSCVSRAIKNLEEEKLIYVKEDDIRLTESGTEKAEDICRKHTILERYFSRPRKRLKEPERRMRRTRTRRAHEAAHLLEHHISERVLDNIKKLMTLKQEGTSLSVCKKGKGIVTDILLDEKVFERLVSMGFSPGEHVEIRKKLPNAIIVKVNNKKFAIDREIASGIKILEE